MKLPRPRGRFSEDLFASMTGALVTPDPRSAEDAEDLHIGLWALYELHYRGFTDVADDWEWNPALLRLRAALERSVEADVRDLAKPLVATALDEHDDLVEQLTHITEHDDGPSLPSFLQRDATAAQYREFLMVRSLYHLKESDPQTWALPRLDGPAKVALAELLYDEFGAGAPARLHTLLFAEALDGAGLDREYGAYIEATPAAVLAVNNVMSLFGLHRRLLGASVGQLTAFEMTSSLPCRRIVKGAERLELDPRVTRYFDEHIEADAVHEQLAARGICHELATQRPDLHDDILLGAAACILLEARAGEQMINAWERDESALRMPDPLEE